MYGAYVAGLDAGFAYNSWPKMGDEWFPSAAPMMQPFLANLVDNPVVVQFVHRWLAWGVAAAVAVLASAAWKRGHGGYAVALLLAVGFQISLGIATLLSGVALHLGVAHQAMAVILLATILAAAHRIGRQARPA
jgi:cytochrome c oxidase assembly protein subunit 15